MPLLVQNIANFGASTPEMARIIIQTDEIAKATTLSPEDRKELLSICQGIAFRLVNARTVAEDIQKRSATEFNRLREKHKPGDAVIEIPYLLNLDILFEGYFYNAKNIIRDLGRVTKVLFGKRFDDASDWCVAGKKTESEVSKYLRRKAGETHNAHAAVRELIEQSREGLQMIVRVRNALEHPGGFSGTVVVNNFKAQENGVHSPTFKFEGEAVDYDIALSMTGIHEVLMSLTETVIVFGLLMKFQLPMMGIKHLKPEERDPAVPMAWKVVLLPQEAMGKGQPFDGKAPPKAA